MIPDFFKNATVAIGTRDLTSNDVQWIATGFFVGVPNVESGKYFTYLVTNRHVIEGMPTNDLLISLNPSDGTPAAEVTLFVKAPGNGVDLWEFHPDPTIDIAVTTLSLGQPLLERFTRNFFELDHHAVRRNEFQAKGLGEGSRASVLGFPMALVGVGRRSVLVRSGALAQLDDFLAGRLPYYLIDCHTYPGNSGGPVINLLEAATLTGTPSPQSVNLIGITAKSVLYRDLALSLQTREIRLLAEYNSGLSVIYSVDDIDLTIQNLVARPAAPSA